jgi:hypothetical protein
LLLPLPLFLLCQVFILESMALHHLGNCLLVVPLDFEIGHLAIALRRLDPGVAQEVLDRHKIRIGIEQLSGHRVALMPSSA